MQMRDSKQTLKCSRPPQGWFARLGDYLTREHASRLESCLRWGRNPLAVIVAALCASILCGLGLGPQGFIAALVLLVVLILGVAWPWLIIRGVLGSFTYQRSRAREGEAVPVSVTIRNRWPLNVWGLAVTSDLGESPDSSPRGIEGHLAFSRVAGRGMTATSWEFTPSCRGVYPRSAPRIATGFPFGLVSASRVLAVPASLLVWPRTFPVGPIPHTAGARCSTGLTLRDRAGHSGDLVGVRTYRRGDPLRRIHWPQTARSGELVICELEESAVPSFQVVLDTDWGVHSGSGPSCSREWAIRIAASFLEDWIGQGADAELLFAGRVLALRDGSVRSRRVRALDALARLGEGETGTLAGLFDLPACKDPGPGLRVVITTDKGLLSLPAKRSSRIPEWYIVLTAASCTGREETTTAPPLRARRSITLDQPDRIPQHLRVAWKEVAHGS